MTDVEGHELYPFEADAAKPELLIQISEEHCSITFIVDGELDTYTSPEVEDQINETLRTATNLNSVVLDLEKVRFMDVTGLRAILSTERNLRARAITLALRNPSENVNRIIDLAGVAKHFEIVTTEDRMQD